MKDKERYLQYVAIVERAERMGTETRNDRLGTIMDIESADLKFELDLDKWLNADDANFNHDYIGIANNIDRSEYPAKNFNFFVPRFAK